VLETEETSGEKVANLYQEALQKIVIAGQETQKYKQKIEDLEKRLVESQFSKICFATYGHGSNGALFTSLVREQTRDGKGIVENIICPQMYLADRHPSLYENLNTLMISNLEIRNSYFVAACFDNVTFKKVVFDKVCFYKANFYDVRFANCTFKDCDFTASKGLNVGFNNCTEQNTDLSLIEIIQDQGESEDYSDMSCYNDQEQVI
jgi:hypothetical protein